jgi:hypothetical protein
MANNFYDLGRKYILDGNLVPASDTIKAALVKSAYTPNLATHQFYNDISADVLNTPQALASKTTTAGVLKAANVTFSSVTLGDTASYVAIYKDTGVAGTSPLIALFDTISGFPFATNGGDVVISWNASGIFRV